MAVYVRMRVRAACSRVRMRTKSGSDPVRSPKAPLAYWRCWVRQQAQSLRYVIHPNGAGGRFCDVRAVRGPEEQRHTGAHVRTHPDDAMIAVPIGLLVGDMINGLLIDARAGACSCCSGETNHQGKTNQKHYPEQAAHHRNLAQLVRTAKGNAVSEETNCRGDTERHGRT